MKSTLLRISLLTIFLVTLLFGLPRGQVLNVQAQTDTEWSAPINLSNSGASSDPSIVVDSLGVAHVIWRDALDGYKYTKSTDGVEWTAPVKVDFPFSPKTDTPSNLETADIHLKMVADTAGLIHMFWTQPNDQSDKDTSSELYYARTPSNLLSQPLSWDAVYVVAVSVLDFDVIADSSNVIHLSYVSNYGTDKEPAGIFYRRFDDWVWAPPVRLYSSQYFRTLALENSHVRLAVAGGGRKAEVYAVWDDRPAKRTFMAKSSDNGVNWQDAVQLRGPEDVTGLALPYNVNVSATGKNVLLTWQLGQPGSLCSQYSQWSTDGGQTISDPIRLSDKLNTCPTNGVFIGKTSDYFLLMLDIFGDLSLVAWNGSEWSALQSQVELNSFTNPLTLNDVILGCRQFAQHADMIFVVGCDQSNNSDIWFRSRKIGDLADWFPLISAWSRPGVLVDTTDSISELQSAAGFDEVVHVLWSQSVVLPTGEINESIRYLRRTANDWSSVSSILSGLNGKPIQISFHADQNDRLLLVWVDKKNGDLLFSWANAEQASRANEWQVPGAIPTGSQANSSPDVAADSSGRILVVYSIPINEQRGIYMVASSDAGNTWSQPQRVFEAVDWDMVDQPKLSMTADGRLHVLFNRYSLIGDQRQPLGMYYSQSSDGGASWSEPQLVTDKAVLWDQIVSFDNLTLHRFWQESHQSMIISFHQVSLDGGQTWSQPGTISTISADAVPTSVAIDQVGTVHFIQTAMVSDQLTIQDQIWDGAQWIPNLSSNISERNSTRTSITAAISQDGFLGVVFILTATDSSGVTKNQIFGIRRFLDQPADVPAPPPVLIPTLNSDTDGNLDSIPRVKTPTPGTSIVELTDTTSASARYKNYLGIALVAVLIFIVLLAGPWRKRTK
ncbi:MAG: hypothetical protein MHPDNHAH_02354 [Anaerolineales bacterium]|nr:hypothetical protein [Anaerolineales bacterium]WKZ47755.1 MAG: hypothetical protein QY306_00120 [Anaerolineales bacterium]